MGSIGNMWFSSQYHFNITIIIILINVIVIVNAIIIVITIINILIFVLVVVLTEDIKPVVNVGYGVILDCEPTSHLDTKGPPISGFFYVPFKFSSLSYST